MTASIQQPDRIEIKLDRTSQLFHTLDPSPFRASDLASEAETYIVDSARELPGNSAIEIIVHLPPDEFARTSASDIAGAIRTYFSLRQQSASREMRELFKTGRLALVVGLTVLSVSLLISWFFTQNNDDGPLFGILSEGFVIFGWVAIWRPSEIFLYSWYPIWRRRKLLGRLAEARVTVVEGRPNPR